MADTPNHRGKKKSKRKNVPHEKLLEASEQGDAKLVRKWLRQGATVDSRTKVKNFKICMELASTGNHAHVLQEFSKEAERIGLEEWRWADAFDLASAVRKVLPADPLAVAVVAYCYAAGLGVPKDLSKGYTLAELSVELGNKGLGKAVMAYVLSLGSANITVDEERAYKLYTEAADSDHVAGIFGCGFCVKIGKGVKRDEREAVRLYKIAAGRNFAVAQCNLGNCYGEGLGVVKDEKEAVRWYTLASEQNHGRAQANLGWAYAQGLGVEKDENEAVRLYKQAVKQNIPQAQCNLSYCYYTGTGVAKDEREAVRLCQLAAKQNLPKALCNLGIFYESGVGVRRDEKEAARFYKLAADLNDARSQYSLGRCLMYGIGVRVDTCQALRLYHLAANQGYEPAVEALEKRGIRTKQ